MNWQILRLVGDHTRRLFGLWLGVAMLQIMQTSALWMLELDRMPLIGAVICAMACFATWDSPIAVMRTLPIRRRDLALYRWWMTIGVPALLLYACIGIAWINNRASPHPPSQLQAGAALLAMVGTLGVLSVLPLPTLKANLSNLSRFTVIWIVLAGVALYGFPVDLVTTPVSLALGVGGTALAVVSFVMASKGEILSLRLSRSERHEAMAPRVSASHPSRVRLHGWRLLFAQLARSTIVLAFACIVCATAARYFLPGLQIVMPLIFVAVAGTAGALMSRRWLNAISALQCLPVRDRTVALVIWAALTAPGLITCLLSNAVNALAPSWGVAVPLFMLPVFVVIPLLLAAGKSVESSNGVAASAQRWSPMLQLSLWPLWAGSSFSFVLTKLVPVLGRRIGGCHHTGDRAHRLLRDADGRSRGSPHCWNSRRCVHRRDDACPRGGARADLRQGESAAHRRRRRESE